MKLSFSSITLVLLTSLISGCKPATSTVAIDPIRPVKLMTINSLSQGQDRTFPARIEANQEANLSFRIAGQVIALPLLEGQEVQKGELLAQLDDRDAHNALLTREANYDLISADFKRKTQLLKKMLISQAEFDTAKAELKSTKAALANAQDQLSYTQLNAPFSGTIAKRIINNHQIVQANQAVLTLQKNATIDVVIQVPETLAASIKDYDEARARHAQITFNAKPERHYPVTLKEYSTEITPGSQTYTVTFSLQQPDDLNVFPGMSAELTLDLVKADLSTAPILLPQTALAKRDSDNASIVWIFDDTTQTVHSSVISIGAVHADGIEVLSGIKLGEQVVVAGIQHLNEDMKVKALRWQRGV
ncbi:efflux RND transporter periplasmic adaptor subunit [Shewanella surugensis]|uniref:Efflux RND transporter periplasmic adaptor subunit n=1 Tax=Shewanella surugensis TaxID=212020 RepID=A0ABT0L6L7_9GAMM|nr:efflux RND transporter periplasmic adaptor subunit [Shewanella surugensis]MCL1123012.1 efflux RND transporter periplasmic adaptor subunit [Shewanella surugensis]